MTTITPAEFQRLIATEFGRRGWDYDLTVGRELLGRVERDSPIDGLKLAEGLSATFLERNRATRGDIADALRRAVGGRTLSGGQESTTLVINDNRYQVNLGAGAHISGSVLNVGRGSQIVVGTNATKSEVLAAVEAIVRAGLDGEWNNAAAADLATVIQKRSDVDLEDVRKVTTDVGRAEKPNRERAAGFMKEVAASGLGGALGVGISAGLGELISQLPI